MALLTTIGMLLPWLLLFCCLGTSVGQSHPLSRRVRRQPRAAPTPPPVLQPSTTLISGFRWIDPKTNQPFVYEGSDNVKNSFTVDVSAIPADLTVEALINTTEGGSLIRSMKFQEQFYGVTSSTVVDNSVPRWFACGNSGSDILPCAWSLGGPMSMVATAYSKPNATGVVLGESSFSVLFFYQATPTIFFTLITPSNQTKQSPYSYTTNSLTNTTTLSLSTTPRLNIRLDYFGNRIWYAQSVVFRYKNKTRTENFEPFAWITPNNATYYNMWKPTVGRHTFTATAYSGRNGQGKSTTRTVTFRVVA